MSRSKRRKSCDRCVHLDVCAVARPQSGELAGIIHRFFGSTAAELARACKRYLDVSRLGDKHESS